MLPSCLAVLSLVFQGLITASVGFSQGFMREPFSFAPLRLEPVQIGSQLSLILHRASQAKVLDLPGKACFLW